MNTDIFKPDERFEQAVTYAIQLHKDQVRKGSGISYLSHLFSVAALTMEFGGTDDEVIAAILHDAVEDQGGEATLNEIKKRFGGNVATIVMGLSDSTTIPKPPWKARKQAYLEHLRTVDDSTRLVSMCDKLHNLRCILRDLNQSEVEDDVWSIFTGGKDGTLWYYDQLIKIYRQYDSRPILKELQDTFAEITIRSN